MRKNIRLKIQKIQAQAEFGVEILARRRGRADADYLKRTLRDDEGNTITQEGKLILSRVRTREKTMTPSEQYRKSHLRRVALGISNLMKD